MPLPTTQLVTGTFQPTNAGAGDPFPAPAPVPSGGSALSVFNRTNPNGDWRLFVVDDLGADVGTISGGWQITITILNQFENPAPVTLPDSGTANPYPSSITVSGLSGKVVKVQVKINNFSHNLSDDVDLLLVAPNGRSVILMSDVGGSSFVSNLSLTFDDAAANSLPDNVPFVSGTYKPTDFELGDFFPAPAPATPPTGRTLAAFNGIEPNGVWSLFAIDDLGGNAGSIANGWTIIVDSSATAITIPTVGTADPYPSEVTVAGLQGTITRVVVALTNFGHASPDDADILLVAPNGRRIVLMSDVGGNTEVGSVSLTFDDTATNSLPDNAPLVSGTYKPTDFETGDTFPAPAPTGAPTGTTLNAFYGSVPNGIWKLFVVDDNGNNFGSLGGWSLNIQSSVNACDFNLSPTVQAFPITGGNGSFNINMPNGCSWTASTNSGFVNITSSTSGDGNGTVGFTVAPNMGGGRSGSINVSNGILTQTFQVQQPSGCPFALNQTSVSFSSSGGNGNVGVTASQICSWLATTNANWIQITSAQQNGDGTASFTVQPNTNSSSRSATVIVGARLFTVNQAGASGRRFDFDGDAKADVSLFRPSSGVWWILPSNQPTTFIAAQFGISTDKLTPADFDGDRKTDLAVYRNGVWYVLQSQSNTVRIESWGLANDTPVPGDYDGDSRADLAVYRPSETTWHIRRSSDSLWQTATFGNATDLPVPADYDGDGRTDFALYRPGATVGAQSFWAILQSSNGASSLQQFGSGGDFAVPADYDGDGRDNIAVFRASNGTWYTSLNPATNYGAKLWGTAGDVPVAADFNGDGRADYAVFRQGVWYILHSGIETIRTESWGVTSDKPILSVYIAQ
jgi:subtilisin-like proprotein convertase family protein